MKYLKYIPPFNFIYNNVKKNMDLFKDFIRKTGTFLLHRDRKSTYGSGQAKKDANFRPSLLFVTLIPKKKNMG